MDHLQTLLRCIDLEEEEQLVRYRSRSGDGEQALSLKQLKAEGIALHPLVVVRKNFGYADYPEVAFKLPFPVGSHQFKDGSSIECFFPGEEPVKGLLLHLEQKEGEFRLFAPDFPEWIEDAGMGIKLTPDTRTTKIMKQALLALPEKPALLKLFKHIHCGTALTKSTSPHSLRWEEDLTLNESQNRAVKSVLKGHPLTIIHGPPGTGKTTTLIAAIKHLVKQGEKIVVSAPSNMAVDHITLGLVHEGVQVLRVGNTSRADDAVFMHTPEGKLSQSSYQKYIKALKIQAEEYRRMALKYKRHFGPAEREQRSLLFKEVKQLRAEIKKLESYYETKLYEEAAVITGTPIGLFDAGLQHLKFGTLIVDEAAQCLEPLAWVIIPLAEKLVLAGDHYQLPPTILSQEAQQLGYQRSILEVAVTSGQPAHLLDLQYRMRPAIAGFSNSYFYQLRLRTAEHLVDDDIHLTFIDTAGAGYTETPGADGVSLQNSDELQLIEKLIYLENLPPDQTALISPYAGQVALAKETISSRLRISTIDSFQGQEYPIVIISLVRSNEDGGIGFLKDYRRMNVAMTRAKDRLYVVGDSATLGKDNFYLAFINYVEKHGAYRSVWEFMS